jgi:membrane protease YdiL (CAAX protease family)
MGRLSGLSGSSRLSGHYLALTFGIMAVGWGTCLLSGVFGVFMDEQKLLYLPYLLGGFSPTIASYIVLKRSGRIRGPRDWLRIAFGFGRGSLLSRVAVVLLVILLAVLSIQPQCLISGYEDGAPFFLIPVLIPAMLFGGGLEEMGWRYILQPELEARLSFTLSTIVTAAVWGLWHLPLFLMQGAGQSGGSYGVFCIFVVGLSFALASVRRSTGAVVPCILLHCVVNALSVVFLVRDDVLGATVSTAILVVLSYVILIVGRKWGASSRTDSRSEVSS